MTWQAIKVLETAWKETSRKRMLILKELRHVISSYFGNVQEMTLSLKET